MFINLFVCVLFIMINSFAQTTFPLAPEVWSKPEKLLPDSISVGYPEFSLTPNGDTLVYCDQFVKYFYKDSSGNWSGPHILSPMYGIPNHSPRRAVFTPDRKTLYFSDKRSWKMYRCRFNEATKEWQQPETFYDNGFNVNRGWYCINFLDDTTMFVVGEERTRLARLRDSLWHPNYAYQFPDGYLWAKGIWLDTTGFRVYQAVGNNPNLEINVIYISDTTTTIFQQEIKSLNLGKMSDSLFQTGEYQGKNEHFPYLTVDRKKMVVLADYHGVYRYYISYLLVDENGDTILTRVNYPLDIYQEKEYRLMQNYPNPFNPVTQIEFALPVKSEISVKVYDILGNEIAVLASGLYEPGRYTVPFDGGSYASGVYIYKLSYGRGQTITKKMTLLK